jgi:hypothetical protein
MKVNLNEYALTAGLLLLFMAVAHAIYGETVVFNDLRFLNFDRALFATVYVPWHQMSSVLFISSVGLIFSSFKGEHRSIQSFVLFVALSNIAILIVAIINGSGIQAGDTIMIFQVWPQFIFFLVLILLIILSIRKNDASNRR